MTHQIEFTSKLPERGIDSLRGFYSIEGTKAHIYLPANPAIPSVISHLDCLETKRAIYCQFINCGLYGVGNDVYEYVAEAAFLGESYSSYKENKYKRVDFRLSNDVLAFLTPTWNFMNDLFSTEGRQIKFTPREARKRIVDVSETVQFSLETGYSQSSSNVRYKIEASALFRFYLQDSVARETVYNFVDSITDFYSLFFQKPVTIQSLQLVSSEDILIGYQGKRLTNGPDGEFFSNHFIEEGDVSDHLSHIADWVNDYGRNQIPLKLFRDASSINDEELKFICLIRCLEVFHKQNFVTTSKQPRSYYEDLHTYATGVGLTDVSLKDFRAREITLVHRILDLVRSVFELLQEERFLFGMLTGLNRVQQIADTRNYLIHFSDSKKEKAIKVDQLPYTNYSLLTFARVVFLKHFSFNDETITILIRAASRRMFW